MEKQVCPGVQSTDIFGGNFFTSLSTFTAKQHSSCPACGVAILLSHRFTNKLLWVFFFHFKLKTRKKYNTVGLICSRSQGAPSGPGDDLHFLRPLPDSPVTLRPAPSLSPTCVHLGPRRDARRLRKRTLSPDAAAHPESRSTRAGAGAWGAPSRARAPSDTDVRAGRPDAAGGSP